MNKTDFEEIIRRSLELRKQYHQQEVQYHGSEWTIEEDALAFLTDAGLVGRNIMSQQGRWPKENAQAELEHKLGENIWWLIVLAERSGIDIKKAVNDFLTKTEESLL
ncbi:MazG-like protein [Parabacteroides sp. FAFU027]|uniref:MazG-like protein n=1 Tax=Parabacteroides sp. FAFU027 TaxID=2922715 RepID=UPI001FAEF461|nr:MazG-like protein [Parabacteroides sp. FAFU027]